MPMASLESYLEKLPARFAELKIMFADVVSLPHMKESYRRQTVNGWTRAALVSVPHVVRPASKGRLAMMGIGVRIEKAEGNNGS